ncbi:putative phosphoesterase [Roseiarcus fermentans]|uniref:Putative phosphoesterase n=1 Tax=Roseiarcus fermentans TaxID=1473586 RepID=A0A366EM52_9HYPH|nr:ligase-associated DNA damage response endonuclease PdeM [Roseiarcus fermentans]RBP03463.1 putative phosphoesterase [Roseiarcus fermentans]
MKRGALDIRLAPDGAALTLLTERAVWSEPTRALFVADLHLGKAAAFRAAGAPAPYGASEETLGRLGALADGFGAERLIVLGDFVHAALTDGLAESLRAWRRARAALDCLVVIGNHDRRAGRLYADCGFAPIDDPTLVDGVACRHVPLEADALDPGPPTLAGHVHPVARISGRGRDSLRLPCFVIDGRQIVLPAFGEFTGGWLVRPEEGRRIVLVAPDRLIEWPGSAAPSRA